MKIYERYRRNYKNKTLHKFKLIRGVISLFAASGIVVVFSSCTINDRDYSNYKKTYSVNPSYNNIVTDADEKNNYTSQTNENGIDFDMFNRDVKFSKVQIERFNEKLNKLKLDYQYKNLFGIDKAYDLYKKMSYYDASKDVKEFPFYKNGRIDANKLFELVLLNNKKYKEGEEFFNKYAEFDDKFVKKVCNIFAETINKEIELGNLDTTLDDTLLNLNDMKVFKAYNLTNGFVTDDNCVCFSSVGLDAMEGITGYDYSTDMIISHEAYHFTQKLSTETRDKQNIERGYGYNVVFEELEVNSLYHNWLIEAAAEQLSCYKYDSEPMTYEHKIGYMHTLSYVLLLDDDFNVKDIEKLTQQQSLDVVFETFNSNTEEEKFELMNLLYAINVIQEEPEDFMSVYMRDVLNKESITDEELVNMKIELKNSICFTLSKYFYKNLADKIANQGISTEEMYRLISIFEMDLSKHFSYAVNGNYDNRQFFIQKYCMLQDYFFDEVALSLNDSNVNIETEYQQYNNSLEIKVDTIFEPAIYEDYNYKTMNEEKNKFANFMYKYLIEYKSISIDEIEDENNKSSQYSIK